MDPASPASATSALGAGPAAGAPDLSGKTLGDFTLLRRLGQGGMGQVYLAEQNSLHRKVALKIMRPELAVHDSSFQRFKAEAEAVARVTHANIVQVYAFGEEAGLHYMALEYVEGRNLREYLAKKGTVDVPLALSIMRQVAAALQRASELGMVHRDIKPENILLTRRGEVKVADFGLSRCFTSDQPAQNLTQTGMALGTPLYMSPEQIQAQPVDPRSDIYSFGVTCYYMLAGQPPFRGQSAFELAMQHVRHEAEPLAKVRPDVPPELCTIVHKMMAKDPGNRYQTCAELLKDLARLRESLALQKTQGGSSAPRLADTQTTDTTPTEALPLPRRRPVPLAAIAGLVIAVLGGGLLAWSVNRPVPEEAAPAQPLVPPPDLVLAGEKKQEKFLREAIEQYANATNDPARRELGVRHALELGLFYLERSRLDDADAFFLGLMENPARPEPYKNIGRLGHAVVLSLQNRPTESNRIFMDMIGGKPLERFPFLRNQPQFRYEIARALDYNRANATPDQPFPQELERWRVPPRPPPPASTGPRRGGADKTGK